MAVNSPGFNRQLARHVVAKGTLLAGENIVVPTNPANGTVYMTIVTEAAAVATVETTMDLDPTDDGLVFASGVNAAAMFFSPLAALSNTQTGQTGPTTGVSIASAGGTTQFTISQWPKGVTAV